MLSGFKKISTKVTIILTLCILLTSPLLGICYYLYEKSVITKKVENEAHLTLDRLSNSLILPLWNFLYQQCEKTIMFEMRNPAINAIALYDEKGYFYIGKVKLANGLVIDYNPDDMNIYDFEEKVKPKDRIIEKDGKSIGKVNIFFSTAVLKKELLYVLVKIIVVVFFISLAIITSCYLALKQYILSPLLTFNALVSTISSESDFVTIPINSEDEIGNLAKTFNSMTRRLKDSFLRLHDSLDTIRKHENELKRYKNHLEELVDKKTRLLIQKSEELSDKNQQIMDSIQYARNIQVSMLPVEEKIDEFLSENFIIWKPRDIIGGDCYWVYSLDGENIIISVIDCTGHGVPGAIMTMLANSLLKTIINEYRGNNPASILQHLNIMTRSLLHKDSGDTLADDGMDIGICHINKKLKEVSFAGARHSLFLLKDSSVTEHKGDSQSIGYSRSREDYQYHTVNFSFTGDEKIYLTSDGYLDQQGSGKGFPFGKKRFKDLLIKTGHLSMAEQKQELLAFIERYRGTDYKQNDDITVLGFKL